MTDAFENDLRPIDRYCDGLLQGQDLEAFEEQAKRDPGLREELVQQRRIDESLRRQFASSSPRSTAAELRRSLATQESRPMANSASLGRRRWLIVAALIAIGAGAAWQAWDYFKPGTVVYPPKPHRTLVQQYQETINAGFKPDWVCETEEEFANTFRKRLRQKLLLGQLPSGAAALGISHCNTISRRSLMLLARVEGKEVIVFVDRVDRDSSQEDPKIAGLNLFNRQVGKLILYELTPMAKPILLEHFYDPQAQPSSAK